MTIPNLDERRRDLLIVFEARQGHAIGFRALAGRQLLGREPSAYAMWAPVEQVEASHPLFAAGRVAMWRVQHADRYPRGPPEGTQVQGGYRLVAAWLLRAVRVHARRGTFLNSIVKGATAANALGHNGTATTVLLARAR